MRAIKVLNLQYFIGYFERRRITHTVFSRDAVISRMQDGGDMHCPISVYPWMVEGKYMLFMENACLPMKYSGYYHQLFVGAYVAVKR